MSCKKERQALLHPLLRAVLPAMRLQILPLYLRSIRQTHQLSLPQIPNMCRELPSAPCCVHNRASQKLEQKQWILGSRP
jgi:hypothetical protein